MGKMLIMLLITKLSVFCGADVNRNIFLKKHEKKPEIINVFVPKRTIRGVECTTYYAPIKGQSDYALGSYKKDVRMNGKGVETSSGTKPEIGTIAADPAHYRRGTILIVPEYGIGIVEDTGFAIRGKKHVDLFMGKGEKGLKSARKWGTKRLNIRVAEVVKVVLR